MQKYLLTEDQLTDNGYPRPTPKWGVASIRREDLPQAKVVPVGPNALRHLCARCKQPFIIYNDGQYQTVESCSYHYGRPYKSRGVSVCLSVFCLSFHLVVLACRVW